MPLSTSRRAASRRLSVESLEPRTLLASTLAYDFVPGNLGVGASDFVTLGDESYFFTAAATNAGLNKHILWKTDGTDAGTQIVKAFDAPSQPPAHDLTAASGRLFFVAQDPVNGIAPWVSDGTDAGTHVLSPGVRIPSGAWPNFVGAGGLTFFNAHSSGSPNWTWVTDGTAEGTHPVAVGKTILDYQTRNLAFSGGKMFVTAQTAAGGIGLYTTDGSDAGTKLVHDFGNDGTTFLPSIDSLTDVNGTLFLVAAAAPGAGKELWKSDGTPEGTVLVKDIRPGPDSSQPVGLTNVNGTLYFAADDIAPRTPYAGMSDELWRSDGTEAGTVKVFEQVAGSDVTLQPSAITDWHGVALFAGTDSAHGTELWRSDGTTDGTYLVSDVLPGPDSGLAGSPGIRAAIDSVYLVARTASSPNELWVTDGTSAGTRRVVGPDVVSPDPLDSSRTLLGDRIILSGAGTVGGKAVHGPWVSDGTAAGTHAIGGINPTPLSPTHIEPPVPFGPDRLLVQAESTIYAVDAANRAVAILPNAWLPGAPYASPSGRATGVLMDDGSLVFAARPVSENLNTVRLYHTDGTASGTYRLADVNLDPNGSFLGHMGTPVLVKVGNVVYFAGSDAAHGVELWRTDGTAAGTSIVKDIVAGRLSSLTGSYSTDRSTFAAVGGEVYFPVKTSPTAGVELWKSDGTPDGTVSVGPIGFPWAFAGLPDKLLFSAVSAQPNDNRIILWASDGTAAGTQPVDTTVSLNILAPIWTVNGAAYFIGSKTGGPSGALFRSDGTAAGTYPLTAGGFAAPTEFATAGAYTYFVSNGQLWRTDGTAAGTMMLPVPGSASPAVASLAAIGDELYFSATDPDHGSELWRTNGTPLGTVLAEDLMPGPASSSPQWLTNVGGTLYFVGYDLASGRELRRLDVTPRIAARGLFSRTPVGTPTGAPGAAPAEIVAADKTALLPGATPSFANVTAADRGITGVLADVFGLPAGAAPAAGDVALDVLLAGRWTPLAPAAVTLERGVGVGGSDRIAIDLPGRSARNTWLRVTLNATANSGLGAPDVFYFASLPGETGDAGWSTVTAADLTRTRAALGSADAAALSRYDFNHDGVVNARDLATARGNQGHALPPLPAEPTPAAAATVALRRRTSDTPPRRSVWELLQ